MFFIFEIKKIFAKLRQILIEALILDYFNPEYHIQIKTNVSGFAMSGIVYQLILDD